MEEEVLPLDEETEKLKRFNIDITIYLAFAYVHYSFYKNYEENLLPGTKPSILFDIEFAKDLKEYYDEIKDTLLVQGKLKNKFRKEVLFFILHNFHTKAESEKIKAAALEKSMYPQSNVDIIKPSDVYHHGGKEDLIGNLDVDWNNWLSDKAAFRILTHICQHVLGFYKEFHPYRHDSVRFWINLGVDPITNSHIPESKRLQICLNELETANIKDLVRHTDFAITDSIFNEKVQNNYQLWTTFAHKLDLTKTVDDDDTNMMIYSVVRLYNAKLNALELYWEQKISENEFKKVTTEVKWYDWDRMLRMTFIDFYTDIVKDPTLSRLDIDLNTLDKIFFKDAENTYRTPQEVYDILSSDPNEVRSICETLDKISTAFESLAKK